jgi:uncharacterized protein (DUF302 family)
LPWKPIPDRLSRMWSPKVSDILLRMGPRACSQYIRSEAAKLCPCPLNNYKRHILRSTVFLVAVVGLALTISIWDSEQASSGERQEKSLTSSRENGIVSIPSHHSVEQTVQKLEEIPQEKGVKLFALIDHSGEAEKVGMQMRPTKLLIFGNPKGGTPLMIASPTIAIDLPLKILVSEDANGKIWISYNSPAYLQARHDVPQDLVPNIANRRAGRESSRVSGTLRQTCEPNILDKGELNSVRRSWTHA